MEVTDTLEDNSIFMYKIYFLKLLMKANMWLLTTVHMKVM